MTYFPSLSPNFTRFISTCLATAALTIGIITQTQASFASQYENLTSAAVTAAEAERDALRARCVALEAELATHRTPPAPVPSSSTDPELDAWLSQRQKATAPAVAAAESRHAAVVAERDALRAQLDDVRAALIAARAAQDAPGEPVTLADVPAMALIAALQGRAADLTSPQIDALWAVMQRPAPVAPAAPAAPDGGPADPDAGAVGVPAAEARHEAPPSKPADPSSRGAADGSDKQES